jgi:hypothetical protein
VIVTKSNFLITLAPYFFPIYVVILVLVFVALGLFWNLRPHLFWFHFLAGAAYAFHVTLTWHALKTHQTDISSSGYFFSAVIIWLGNVLVLLISLPMVTGHVGVLTAVSWSWIETGRVFQLLARWF